MVTNSVLYPINVNNNVIIGSTASTRFSVPKLEIHPTVIINSIDIQTTGQSTNYTYNPYNHKETPTLNLYYNFTTSGTLTYNSSTSESITLYYFIMGSGGNGGRGKTTQGQTTDGTGGGGGSSGQIILGNITITSGTEITINVGKSSEITGSQPSSILVGQTQISALGGNNGADSNFPGTNGAGGASVNVAPYAGAGAGGNGGFTVTDGGNVTTVTFADGKTNTGGVYGGKYIGGGGGGGGGYGGRNGGNGGGGGGGGLLGVSVIPGIGVNGNNGTNLVGGNGFTFSTGGVGGGGGGNRGIGGDGVVMLYFLNTIADETLYVEGNATISQVCSATTFTNLSDYRIKENVISLNNSLSNVNNLRPVLYKNIITKNRDIGFIAHELQQYYPDLVTGKKDDDEYQTVNYIGLIPVLVKTVQELNSKVNLLENKITELKNKM
jgi:hypothetical protein